MKNREIAEVWDSNTKVPGGRDDMASYKSRLPSITFDKVKNIQEFSSNSIAWDKKDTYQKHTVLKYIVIYSAVIIVIIFEREPKILQLW